MHQRYFFDTSFFIAIIKREPGWERCAELLQRLKRAQKFTSVLVAYELHRGTPSAAGRQSAVIDEWLQQFTVKPVTLAHALSAAHIFRRQASKGRADPIIAAQAVEGGYQMVTTNRQDFERVPGLHLVEL